ncbi:TRM11 family SAM-dependent methyltransferase [Anaerosporobacter faecicola]|uniref:TRM11 family SAM-dependent methyltransferase n=1 Tax=Anaerosporobacter faecicola TaxID=2718714 RepID=UPI0014399024|nr:methyltransferase [Anaerosporobacter faecicola]
MVRDTFDAIINQIEVRQNLSKLRQEIKEEENRVALLYYLSDKKELLPPFLKHEDAKTRKNAVLLMGDLQLDEYLPWIVEGYKNETQRFVKSSYLVALRNFDYREYLPYLKECLEQLLSIELVDENRKHIEEEIRELTSLIVTIEGVRKHTFTGDHKKSKLLLLTNRNHIPVTLTQVQQITPTAKAFNAGVMVKTDELEEIRTIRTYQEMLFVLDQVSVCPVNPIQAAKMVSEGNVVSYLEERHREATPFYFRVEVKSKMELSKKSEFAKKFASELERLTKRKMINSTSQYEVEIRFIENKDGNFNIVLKLFTIKDNRFAYRKQAIASSIRPVNAALTVALAKEYMKEDAQVLDPFCGVGTMLIERHKQVKAYSTYGLDIYGEAIEAARENTQAARQVIHYVNRDFFDFQHEYLFDEIITDMPFTNSAKQEQTIIDLYGRFFKKAYLHLKEDGIIIMYCHNRELAKRNGLAAGFVLLKEYEISRKEGTYVMIFEKEE